MYTAIAIGRLVREPELRYTPNGKELLSFTLACKRSGEKDITDFADVTVFGQTALYLSQYGHKGDIVTVSGNQCIDSYTGKDGNKKKSFYIKANYIELHNTKKSSVSESTETSIEKEEIPFKPSQSFVAEQTLITDDDLPF